MRHNCKAQGRIVTKLFQLNCLKSFITQELLDCTGVGPLTRHATCIHQVQVIECHDNLTMVCQDEF